MAIEIQFDTSDMTSYQMKNQQTQFSSNPNTTVSHSKDFNGSATLSDGSSISFTFTLNKVNSIPTSDITDRDGTYTITVEKT